MAVPPLVKSGPGSFTKNMAWHGKGLLALHQGIRTGFGGQLKPVVREDFRSATSLDNNQFLLAANFFLANRIQVTDNIIQVDELVRQAVSEPHSSAFDKLGFFVLNLSLGGKRRGVNGVEYPAPWANAFVKQALWQGGRWQSAALREPDMDMFFSKNIIGVPLAQAKVRSNYRHFFDLLNFIPSASPSINTLHATWMPAALFTAWDRRAIVGSGTGGPPLTTVLVADSDGAEDWKLLGISREEFLNVAPSIADQYVQAGGLQRFISVSSVIPGPAPIIIAPPPPAQPAPTPPTSKPGMALAPPSPTPPISPADLSWLMASAEDVAVDRQMSSRFAQKRDQVLATKMKALYHHQCMACGHTVIIGLDPERRYAEAAHIKPLGKPHNGPDKSGNLIVLCPVHHLQLDAGILSLRRRPGGGAVVEFVSRIPSDPLNKKVLALHSSHVLDTACIDWHATTYAIVGK